ncbi:MAG: hypothetical protein GX894_09040 [Clostridia bacterium]|nr:hypothetical protein [Clostridia bacterium]
MPIVAKVLKLICYIPEAFVVGLACLTFVGIRPVMKRMALFGVVYGCSIFLFRDLLLPWLGLPLGIHTVILFMINALLLGLFFGLNLPGSVICAFLYFLVLTITEPLVSVVFKLIGISMSEILASLWLSTLFNCLGLSLIFIVVYLFRKRNYTLLPITKLIKDERDD